MNIKKIFAICLSMVLVTTMFTSCKKDVKNEPYTIKFNDVEYIGEYTGTMEKDLPVENGTFIAGDKGDEDYAKYTGSWSEGLANGKGKLIGYNEDGVRYNYVGEFVKGSYEGKGKLIYNDEDYYIREGRFKKGEFNPTFVEFIRALGTCEKNCYYDLSDNEKKIIENNEKIFKNNIKTKAVKNAKKINLDKFKIEPDAYKGGFAKATNLQAFQVVTDSFWGYKITGVGAIDDNGNNYTFNIIGDSKGIREGDYFDAYFLPIDYTSYESVQKDSIYTILGLAVTLEK